jgi:hypothetical protein
MAPELVRPVDGDDVRVGERGGGAGLAQEPLAEVDLVAERRWKRLDRDVSVEMDVAGQVDDSHSASPELALEEILAGEGVAEGGGVGVGGRHLLLGEV